MESQHFGAGPLGEMQNAERIVNGSVQSARNRAGCHKNGSETQRIAKPWETQLVSDQFHFAAKKRPMTPWLWGDINN